MNSLLNQEKYEVVVEVTLWPKPQDSNHFHDQDGKRRKLVLKPHIEKSIIMLWTALDIQNGTYTKHVFIITLKSKHLIQMAVYSFAYDLGLLRSLDGRFDIVSSCLLDLCHWQTEKILHKI